MVHSALMSRSNIHLSVGFDFMTERLGMMMPAYLRMKNRGVVRRKKVEKMGFE